MSADSSRIEDAAPASIPPGGELGAIAPSPDGLADAAERDRVFEALFGTRAERRTFGRYLVLGTLGRGAMGTVLEAYDSQLERRLAIKVLHADTSARDAKRLVREAQALAKLSHPNVVQVYEVGEVQGQVFIAMERARGHSLQRWQKQRHPWQECVRVYMQAARGLAAAHGVGLVHRDFKPGNCIVDDQGRVRVLDFGLARKLDLIHPSLPSPIEPKTLSQLTTPGAVLGTLAYMPLEQLQGQPADARSDQFSFCVSLYEAIYGERPFRGDSVAATTGGLLRRPPNGIRVPSRLRRLLLRGLSVEPQGRWPSMDVLLLELEGLVPRRRPWWSALRVMMTGLRRRLRRGLASQLEVEASLSSNLGAMLSAQGRHEEALARHRRALSLYEECLGAGHPDVALAHSHIGAVLRNLGKLEDAHAHHRRALAIYEGAVGPRHPELELLLQGLRELARAPTERASSETRAADSSR
jgi:predicted Ser/Thr protein kinase